MVATLVGEPGDMDREAEIAIGISEVEEFLRIDAEIVKVQDVGRSVMEIADLGFQRKAGHIISTGYVMPRSGQIRKISPGIYGFN